MYRDPTRTIANYNKNRTRPQHIKAAVYTSIIMTAHVVLEVGEDHCPDHVERVEEDHSESSRDVVEVNDLHSRP